MREILFRGKEVESSDWYYGDIFHSSMNVDTTRIHDYINRANVVIIPDTLGQYTGLTDKNGTKIFEGDILQGDEYPYCSDGEYNYYAEVIWFDNGCCGFGLCTHKNPKSAVRGISDGNCEWFEDFDSNNWSVVGNIYDNPELIGEEGEQND